MFVSFVLRPLCFVLTRQHISFFAGVLSPAKYIYIYNATCPIFTSIVTQIEVYHCTNIVHGYQYIEYYHKFLYMHIQLDPPVVPFYPFFGRVGEGSPTKIDYRKKVGTRILTSLLEDLEY